MSWTMGAQGTGEGPATGTCHLCHRSYVQVYGRVVKGFRYAYCRACFYFNEAPDWSDEERLAYAANTAAYREMCRKALEDDAKGIRRHGTFIHGQEADDRGPSGFKHIGGML